jgi:hypothetical protein
MANKQKIVSVAFHVAGAAMVANGIWMVSLAVNWFFHIPADMSATGEPNGHLIRDVGIAYIVFGAGLTWCALRPATRRPVFLLVACFMSGHALGHVIEILAGLLPTSHWRTDFPLVLLPGLLFAALAFRPVWASLVGIDSSDG